MTLSTPEPSGRRASTDWLWGGLGLTIASVSATFAAYMIATAPPELTGSGSKEWRVFVRFDRRAPALAENGPRPASRPEAVKLADAETAIDTTPTGSIEPGAVRIASQPTAGPPGPSRSTDLHDFILRDVIGNRALIEHRKKLSLVKPGSVLDDAGEVLAIERRGNAWIVRTASGIIGGL